MGTYTYENTGQRGCTSEELEHGMFSPCSHHVACCGHTAFRYSPHLIILLDLVLPCEHSCKQFAGSAIE